MGIPSFTKYLEDRSQQYFEKYELYNCSVVIDGNNICNNLYNWQYTYWKSGFSPYCYGGDYDKYAEIVKQFFRLLSECNVTPYVLFDSCSENDRVSLIKLRLNEKAKINSEITPASRQPTYGVGAVALRYAFRDVVKELQLKVYTCISDANKIMTCLARHLNCPVLSTDSDFFVSGAMFIPFSSINCQNQDYKKRSYKSVTCKIYKIENLKTALNNRPNMHYLIPVLLGNKQFSTDIFNPFFKQSRIFGGRNKKLDLIFQWLKRQYTIETAINEILKNFTSREQKLFILKVIKSTVMGYTPVSITSVLEYFHIKAKEDTATSFNFKKVEEVVGLTLTMEKAAHINDIQVSELFEKYRECKYPAFFMDMLLENRYFVWPNIEDCSKSDANSIGYNVMSAIHNILVQTDEKRLTVLRRNKDIKLEEFLLPAYQYSLPSIEEIDYLRLERKQDFIFGILEIDQQFSEIFESLPKEWHLFILSLKYATSKSQFNPSFIYSLIFCFITLNYIDPKLKGFYRSIVDLQDCHKVSQNFGEMVEGTKFSISEEDSIFFMQKVIKYFEKDGEDNAETYDREIMHSIAEIQCVFLHLKFLNNLLDFPFKDVFIYKVFDGTFIYNMAKYLKRELSVKNYISIFLKDCLNIYCIVISIIELLEKHSIA